MSGAAMYGTGAAEVVSFAGDVGTGAAAISGPLDQPSPQLSHPLQCCSGINRAGSLSLICSIKKVDRIALRFKLRWPDDRVGRTSQSGAKTIYAGLIGLAELLVCTGDFIHSPSARQTPLGRETEENSWKRRLLGCQRPNSLA
ncbi:hypothetical protein Nepgr_008437 [Nepenthes gracilis]|uniref:Uncharacterized protein n=1 Tax=Nepenthes gracilis TaxID=150966 RepID=A0AAD3XJ82_NEPGR|nr:hypothetical protein Nepgr_008437 [Nepenthes gracilis]